MTGIITSIPPLVEQPPGNNSSNPAGLPGVTYTVAVLNIPQTWTAKQTFPLGNISLNAADISGLAPSATIDATNASNITSGTLPAARLPALTGDVTTTAGSVATAIGATKVTSAMLNADVFSTAHSWAGQQTFVAPILGDATGSSVFVTRSDGGYQFKLVNTGAFPHTYGFAVRGTDGGFTLDDITNGASRISISPTGAVTIPNLTFTQAGTGAVTRTMQDKVRDIVSVKDFGASGSAQTTTGTINAASNAITLASAIDFANGQGILVFGAGAATTVGAPTLTAVAPVNTTGATTYAYQIASLDNQGGLTAATAATTITNGYATLGTYLAGTAGIAMNKLTWTNGTGSPLCTLVWRSTSGGAYVLLGCFTGTSIFDTGIPTQTIVGIPATPPASAVPGWLATTITSGGGTASLTLANTATTSVAGALVQHDDTAAINAAMAANSAVSFPAGTFNVRGLQIPSTVRSVIGVGGGNSIINALAQTADGLNAGVTATMGNRPFYMTGIKVIAGIPMAFDGFTLNQGLKSTIALNEFSGAAALRILGSDKTEVIGNQISNWWNVGIFNVSSTNSTIAINAIGPIAAQVGSVALTATPVGSNYQYGSGIWSDQGSSGYLISNNNIDQRGGSFGIASQGPNGSTLNNDIKYTGRESMSVGVLPNYKVSGNRSYWLPAGNGNQSSYDFGMSAADNGTNAISNGDISNNTIINSAFSGIGIWGNGVVSYTNVNVSGNVISGSNQISGVHTCGIELSGSNVSAISVGSNTFQSVTGNMTYNVCEQNSGAGVPNNNTVAAQLGPAGTSGVVSLLGANSVSLGNGSLSYTPTVVCVTATATATGKWERISKTKVFVQITITVSGAGNITSVSLPTTSASAGSWSIAGREVTAGGFWYGYIGPNTNTATVFLSSNSNTVANGYTITLSGTYDSV